MIPKIIHYCWFGGNPLPESAIKCIQSWKKYCPDYEIKEWNESNFNINCCKYMQEAYKEKKWAFVSDYARFFILYNEGGIYFDTDVEVVKSFDDIIENGAFMGSEKIIAKNGKDSVGINPGLGIGIEPKHEIFESILNFYNKQHFINEKGEMNTTTVVEYTSDIMKEYGWSPNNNIQNIDGIIIYPPEYFSPKDYVTGKIELTEQTHSIHHYSASWFSTADKMVIKISRYCNTHFQGQVGKNVSKMLTFPFRVRAKYEKLHFKGTVRFIMQKIYKK